MELILDAVDFAEDHPMNGFSSGGELYFTVGDVFFPAEHWYDCAYTDLQIWLPRLISFGSNHTDSCELDFMDGPYTLRLCRQEDGFIRADCLQDHCCIRSEKNVDLRTLFKSVLSCCRKYDRFLYEKGINNFFQQEINILMTLFDT
jgi:hypothetical protein